MVESARHRWSKFGEHRSTTERESLGVLRVIARFRPYLWGRRFTPVTDYSAAVGLFKSQGLSPELHWWALWLMMYDGNRSWNSGSSQATKRAIAPSGSRRARARCRRFSPRRRLHCKGRDRIQWNDLRRSATKRSHSTCTTATNPGHHDD